MRPIITVILTLLTLFTGTAILTACANDPIPTAPSTPQPIQPQPAAQTSAPPEPQRNRALIMRLTTPADVFPYPANGLHQPDRIGAGALLLADGWLALGSGQIWLRLDLNGERVGWLRLDESPLTLGETQTLPNVPAPSPASVLPAIELEAAPGVIVRATLLGRSADDRGYIVHLPPLDGGFWIDREIGAVPPQPDRLPVYTGSIAGTWTPWRGAEEHRLEVDLTGWASRIHAWPSAPPLAYRLPSGRYPVLGRSLDGGWLAVRVDDLEPPVAWLSANHWNQTPRVAELANQADLPLFLSLGLEVVTLDADGRAAASSFAGAPGSDWEWRSDDELLISGSEGGAVIWNVVRSETRPLSQRQLANISPDGRYAVAEFMDDETPPIDWQQPRNVALVSLDDGSEVSFPAVYKPWGTDAPGFQQFWSADSRWLYSTVARYGDESYPTRHFALSVAGELVEIAPADGAWLTNWSRLQEFEQAGGEITYRNAAGEPIARPWSAAVYPVPPLPPDEFPLLPQGWRLSDWSPDGRLLLAARTLETGPVDDQGLAALTWGWSYPHGNWGVREFGVFDAHGELRQRWRAFGPGCGSMSVHGQWSRGGSHIVFGPRWAGCQ